MREKTPEPDSLPDALLQSVVHSDAPGLLMDMGEEILDAVAKPIIKNEALLKIPVIGVAVGLAKGILDVRDRLYVRKLLSFLSETSAANDKEREKYAQKLASNPKESKRASVTILEILDRITSAEKAKLLAKVFRAYLAGDFVKSVEDLRHLGEMIDRTYLQDLIDLQNGTVANLSNLVNVGIRNSTEAEDIMKLMEQHTERNTQLVSRGMTPSIVPAIDLGYTPAGLNLINILRHYK